MALTSDINFPKTPQPPKPKTLTPSKVSKSEPRLNKKDRRKRNIEHFDMNNVKTPSPIKQDDVTPKKVSKSEPPTKKIKKNVTKLDNVKTTMTPQPPKPKTLTPSKVSKSEPRLSKKDRRKRNIEHVDMNNVKTPSPIKQDEVTPKKVSKSEPPAKKIKKNVTKLDNVKTTMTPQPPKPKTLTPSKVSKSEPRLNKKERRKRNIEHFENVKTPSPIKQDDVTLKNVSKSEPHLKKKNREKRSIELENMKNLKTTTPIKQKVLSPTKGSESNSPKKVDKKIVNLKNSQTPQPPKRIKDTLENCSKSEPRLKKKILEAENADITTEVNVASASIKKTKKSAKKDMNGTVKSSPLKSEKPIKIKEKTKELETSPLKQDHISPKNIRKSLSPVRKNLNGELHDVADITDESDHEDCEDNGSDSDVWQTASEDEFMDAEDGNSDDDDDDEDEEAMEVDSETENGLKPDTRKKQLENHSFEESSIDKKEMKIDQKREVDLCSRTILLTQVPMGTSIKELKSLSEDILSVSIQGRVTKEFISKKAKTYAFLHFVDKITTLSNISTIDGKEIHGSKLRALLKKPFVTKTRQNPEIYTSLKLHVEAIDNTVTVKNLKHIFPDADDIRCPKASHSSDKGLNKGIAFVEYSDATYGRKAHEIAHNTLVKGSFLSVSYGKKDKHAKIVSEKKLNNAKEDTKTKIIYDETKLCVTGLHVNITQEMLYDSFPKASMIYLRLDKSDRRKNIGTATVSFIDKVRAAEAMKNMQGKLLLDVPMQISYTIDKRHDVRGNVFQTERHADLSIKVKKRAEDVKKILKMKQQAKQILEELKKQSKRKHKGKKSTK